MCASPVAEPVAALVPVAGPTTAPVRVVVAAASPVLDAVLRGLAGEGVQVVATAADGGALVDAFRLHRPDVVLSEWRLPGLGGARALERLRALDPAVRVVFLSPVADPAQVRRSLGAGGCGHLLTPPAGGPLSSAVRAAARGHVVLDTATSRALIEGRTGLPAAEHADGPLTERERAVLRLVAEGRTNAQIAARLGIRLTTVKTHLGRIGMKLGVHGRVAAAREAGALGLLGP